MNSYGTKTTKNGRTYTERGERVTEALVTGNGVPTVTIEGIGQLLIREGHVKVCAQFEKSGESVVVEHDGVWLHSIGADL